MTDARLTPLKAQLLWDRLLALVEEQAQTLMRTAFSTVVREAGDLSAGVFDTEGKMIAQAITGTPGHVNAMAAAVGHFLARYPLSTLVPGDVLVTNDPWLGTGHLNDFTVVTPVFYKDACVGLFASTSHIADVGGRGFGPEAGEVFEEGLNIPICKLFEADERNETLFAIVAANVRDPQVAEGDLYSLVTCNATSAELLVEVLAEFDQSGLEQISQHILETSGTAMRQAISELPEGEVSNSMRVDGYDEPIDLHCKITIADPEHCILNARPPAAVSARHALGQLLPDVVLGAMAVLLPDSVPAEGAACIWNPVLLSDPADEASFVINPIYNGGTGARPDRDGLATTAFPSGVRTTPTEINEVSAPLIIWQREFAPDSGGGGRYRGGAGQRIEISHANDRPFWISRMFDRIQHPARGRAGGEPGALGWVGLKSGAAFAGKGKDQVPAGDRLVMVTPGGGGHGSA